MHKSNLTTLALLEECNLLEELNSEAVELYKDWIVYELPARDWNESTLFLLIDENNVENIVCDQDWWDKSLASEEYQEYFEKILEENNLTLWW